MRTAKDNFWLDTPYEAGPALAGDHETDVAIIGGGFTGVASAYFMKKRFPEKRILVLESDFIGFGSSGRNQGIAPGMFANSALFLKKTHGIEKTVGLQRLANQALSLVEDLIKEHDIDCDYEKTGRLLVAENGKATKLLEQEAKACEEVGARATWLGREEVRSRFGGLQALAGLYYPDEGQLNPAKLVRGMKNVVERLGVEVYEHSRCTHIEPGPAAYLYTPLARVRAANIVIATNAYSNPLGLFRHKVLPLYVYNIATEPLTQEQMDQFHWTGRVPVLNQKNLFWMLRLTADNRLVFIDNDALHFYHVDRDYSHRPAEYRSHYKLLLQKFPFLKGIKMTHQWGGRIGITLDFVPSIGCTGKYHNVYYSMGYNGHGLTLTHLAGKMLAELMAGEKTDLTDHMLINKRIFGVPSASITYLGINAYKSYFKISDYMLAMGK